MRIMSKRFMTSVLLLFALSILIEPASACTGVLLRGEDGTVVRGRTMEWGKFDMKTEALVVPSGMSYQASTPDGDNGIAWKGKYGFVGMNMLGSVVGDGMNEKGLSIGAFYHHGFAKYTEYDPQKADISMGPVDLMFYILSKFSNVEEVRQGLSKIRVVPVVDPHLERPWPAHIFVTGPKGKPIVIEFTEGKIKIHDNPVGVVTNNPNFDWHLLNLRNYGYISREPFSDKKWGDLEITPLAGGSGMLGLPGDFTSPSRFVRAVVFSQYSRETSGGFDTVEELFRILDNFNVGASQGEGGTSDEDVSMPSSTQWTIAHDTKNLNIYYHTSYNRRVRKIDMKEIDFARKEKRSVPLDEKRVQDIKDVTAGLK